MVYMENDSMELNAQIKIKRHFAFVARNLFSDKDLKESTDWKDYFPTNNGIFVVSSDDSLKKSDNNNEINIDDLPNQKPCR